MSAKNTDNKRSIKNEKSESNYYLTILFYFLLIFNFN
jgi:hypothetical protein